MAVMVACAALVPGAVAAPHQASWLPPELADAVVQQLAERIALVPEMFDGREPSAEQRLAVARRMIGEMAGVITGWGVEETLARAPEITAVKIGPAGNPYLDAMARYQVCNMLLYLQLRDPAYNEDVNIRVTSVFGLSAVTLAVLSLREPLVAGGGDPATIEAHLSGPMLEPALQALQTDAARRARVEAECRPTIIALLEKPLTSRDR